MRTHSVFDCTMCQPSQIHAKQSPGRHCLRERWIWTSRGPFESQHLDTYNGDALDAHLVRTRNWMRARGKISVTGGHIAHLNALAYMTDSFFIGTIARAHRVWRNPPTSKDSERDTEVARRIKSQNGGKDKNVEQRPEIGMMVSLDHTIFFHRPKDFKADEWLFSEMDTPWSGDGRGVVTQRIWTKDGKLVATCFQEVGMRQLG